MALTFLLLSMALNVLVLVPVLAVLLRGGQAAQLAWGPDTAARRILACIYAAIMLMSGALLLGHFLGWNIAIPALSLLAVQVVYKLLTVPAVGLKNPVVASNLGIAMLHGVTIWLNA